MAKIHEERIVVKVSKLIADNEVSTMIISDEMKEAVLEVARELISGMAGDQIVIEVDSNDTDG